MRPRPVPSLPKRRCGGDSVPATAPIRSCFPRPYEPVAAMAFAALARVAYRHRSAFLPFVITGAAFILAAIIHRHHPGMWVLVAVVTVAAGLVAGVPHRLLWAMPARNITAGIVTRVWEACGITRPAERVYVTAVVVTGGGWLSAAIAAGPLIKPCPLSRVSPR